jgi:PAS domain-containing protein
MGQGNSQETSVNLDGTAWAETPALFRMVVDRIPGVLWAVDSELRFTASFGAALRDLNLLPNQVVGKTLYEYFATTDESFPGIASHRRALQGEASDFDIRWMQRLFQVHVEPLRDGRGQIAGCVGYARDTTEHQRLIDSQLQYQIAFRRQAESQQAIFQRLVEEAGQIFLVAGRDHRITYVNAFGCQLLGQSVVDLIGDHLPLLIARTQHVPEALLFAVQGFLGDPQSRDIRDDRGESLRVRFRIVDEEHVLPGCDANAGFGCQRQFAGPFPVRQYARKDFVFEPLAIFADIEPQQRGADDVVPLLAQQLAGALLQFQSYEYQRELHPDRARETFAAGMAALRQAHLEARRLTSTASQPLRCAARPWKMRSTARSDFMLPRRSRPHRRGRHLTSGATRAPCGPPRRWIAPIRILRRTPSRCPQTPLAMTLIRRRSPSRRGR